MLRVRLKGHCSEHMAFKLPLVPPKDKRQVTGALVPLLSLPQARGPRASAERAAGALGGRVAEPAWPGEGSGRTCGADLGRDVGSPPWQVHMAGFLPR